MSICKPLAVVLSVSLMLLSACGNAPQQSLSSSVNVVEPSPSSAAPVVEATPAADTELSAEQKQEDLDFLCQQLEQKHKNLFAKTTKEQFYEAKQGVADKIPTLSDNEFYLELKRLVATVGDAHTNIALNDSIYKSFRAMPFAVMKIEDNWHLAMAEELNKQYLGWIVTAINDTNIEEVYTRASKLVSHENEAWMGSQFSNTINFADTLQYLGVIPNTDSATLHLKNVTTGEKQSIVMPSMSEQEIFAAKITSIQPKTNSVTNPSGIYRAQPLNDAVYFIQYNSCEEAKDLLIKDFVKIVEDELTSKNYSKVIVDMRYNSGGNSAIFEPVINKLGELQNKQNFKLYTLIGQNTFSSAIINSIQMQKRTKTTLVGSPTGGNVNGYGEVKSFKLPNLHASVRYSTKYFELVKDYAKDSLYPDITVTPTYEQVLEGTDSVVETVLAM